MYQCPGCQTTFETLPEICPHCKLSLRVLAITPILTRHDDTLIVLTACDTQLDAQIVIGRLKSEGIDAMLSGTSMQSTLGSSDAGSDPYHILVHQSDGERALRLIGSDASWTEDELTRYISMLAESTED